MLWSIFAVLLVFYTLCLYFGVTLGGGIHLLVPILIGLIIFAVKSDREK